MLKLATTLLGLTLASGSAQAQETERLQFPLGAMCDPITAVEEFVDKHGEKSFASSDAVVLGLDGNYYKGKMIIYVNPETFETTTVIEFPQDEISCILAVGQNFGPAIQDPSI